MTPPRTWRLYEVPPSTKGDAHGERVWINGVFNANLNNVLRGKLPM